ncbi:metal ABC transporter permease [Paenibacillus sp.]|uniref:metal ABC transporter permease n=1 Tax=Paenibacillus sp. TaxID=58172 RepID=UPI002D37FEB1|nr:metal ABC transporter permease [Paenibacillus sp.]HZG58081.1 metal ABC transporter permease [Paenibacillus sp.]
MWDIFAFPFFQRALVGGLLIGGMAPLLGMYLVLRRLSMIGDTIAHVSIAGIALGFLLGVYPVGVGLVFSLVAAFAIERLRSAYRTYAELSIAIIMSGGVALATFLFTLGQGFNINVTSYFFGSIYSLDAVDLYTIFGVTIVVFGVIAFHGKEYFLLTFDEDAASVGGLPVRALNLTLTALTALVISVSIKILGALLVSALLTIPVASSLLIGRSFKRSIVWAIVFSETAVLLGLVAAGLFNLAPGATIVLLLIVILIGLLTLKKGFRL